MKKLMILAMLLITISAKAQFAIQSSEYPKVERLSDETVKITKKTLITIITTNPILKDSLISIRPNFIKLKEDRSRKCVEYTITYKKSSLLP